MNPNMTDEQYIRKYYELTNPDNKPHWGNVFPPVKGDPALFSMQINSVGDALKMCQEYNGRGMCCMSMNGMQGGAKADHITSIDNIFIDYDVDKKRRIKGLSTEEDKQAALEGIKKIVGELRNVINLQPSLLVGSGNGHQTFVPLSIKLSEDPEEKRAQIKDVQAKLAIIYEKLKKFDTDIAHVDVNVIKEIKRVEIAEFMEKSKKRRDARDRAEVEANKRVVEVMAEEKRKRERGSSDAFFHEKI